MKPLFSIDLSLINFFIQTLYINSIYYTLKFNKRMVLLPLILAFLNYESAFVIVASALASRSNLFDLSFFFGLIERQRISNNFLKLSSTFSSSKSSRIVRRRSFCVGRYSDHSHTFDHLEKTLV